MQFQHTATGVIYGAGFGLPSISDFTTPAGETHLG
jgi:hypothetical protein